MLNQVVLVGRLEKEVELIKKGDTKYSTLYLIVPRSFKNKDGEYEEDHIKIKVFGSIAENAAEYVKVKDLVGIKGRLQSYENELQVIAEKLTFLQASSTNKESK